MKEKMTKKEIKKKMKVTFVGLEVGALLTL